MLRSRTAKRLRAETKTTAQLRAVDSRRRTTFSFQIPPYAEVTHTLDRAKHREFLASIEREGVVMALCDIDLRLRSAQCGYRAALWAEAGKVCIVHQFLLDDDGAWAAFREQHNITKAVRPARLLLLVLRSLPNLTEDQRSLWHRSLSALLSSGVEAASIERVLSERGGFRNVLPAKARKPAAAPEPDGPQSASEPTLAAVEDTPSPVGPEPPEYLSIDVPVPKKKRSKSFSKLVRKQVVLGFHNERDLRALAIAEVGDLYSLTVRCGQVGDTKGFEVVRFAKSSVAGLPPPISLRRSRI